MSCFVAAVPARSASAWRWAPRHQAWRASDGQPALRCGRVRSAGSAHCKLGAWLLRNASRFSARAPRCFHRTHAGPANGIDRPCDVNPCDGDVSPTIRRTCSQLRALGAAPIDLTVSQTVGFCLPLSLRRKLGGGVSEDLHATFIFPSQGCLSGFRGCMRCFTHNPVCAEFIWPAAGTTASACGCAGGHALSRHDFVVRRPHQHPRARAEGKGDDPGKR